MKLLLVAFLAMFATAMAGPLARIINGNDADPHEFPWQVRMNSTSSNSHRCGAALISNTRVLTAGHCVNTLLNSPNQIKLVLGDHKGDTKEKNELTVDVKRIILHPGYNQGSGFTPNDIAILIIDEVQFNDDIQSIAIADANFDPTGMTCQITGWGHYDGKNISPALQKADMEIMSYSACREEWTSSVTEKMVCLTNSDEKTASCNGDSGGPLVCNGNILTGITSWGVNGCGTTFLGWYPSVYTRVSSYNAWINGNM